MSCARVAIERVLAGTRSRATSHRFKTPSSVWQPQWVGCIPSMGNFRWNSTIVQEKDSTPPPLPSAAVYPLYDYV